MKLVRYAKLLCPDLELKYHSYVNALVFFYVTIFLLTDVVSILSVYIYCNDGNSAKLLLEIAGDSSKQGELNVYGA
jgi:hypothetical protein